MKRKLFSGLGAVAGVALLASAAHAVPTVSFTVSSVGSQGDQSAPAAAETDFLDSLEAGYTTEGFEGFNAGTRQIQLFSGVGSFVQATAGGGGLCETLPGGCSNGIAILDSSTSPYVDRFAVGGSNWMDNVGTRSMVFAPIAGINSIGFFAADMGDSLVDYSFSILSAGVSTALGNIFAGTVSPQANLRYITFSSTEDIQGLWITTNQNREGYGIDNVTVGRLASVDAAGVEPNGVPEPGTMALLGLGLLGARLVRRRQIA